MENYHYYERAMGATLKYENTDNGKWCFDSGTTSYMNYMKDSFMDMNEIDKTEVKVANGSLVEAKGCAIVKQPIPILVINISSGVIGYTIVYFAILLGL